MVVRVADEAQPTGAVVVVNRAGGFRRAVLVDAAELSESVEDIGGD